MTTDLSTCRNLFAEFIKTCFSMLFLPHNSAEQLTSFNYERQTNTHFPDCRLLKNKYEKLLKEIPIKAKEADLKLTAPSLYAMQCFHKLMDERGLNINTNIAPIYKYYFILFEGVGDTDKARLFSLLNQVLCAYSDSVTGNIDIYLPCVGYLGVQTLKDSANTNKAPFWAWFDKIIDPGLSQLKLKEDSKKVLTQLSNFALPFYPLDLDTDQASVPYVNFIKIRVTSRLIKPDNKPTDNAARIIQGLEYVNYGIPHLDVIVINGSNPQDNTDNESATKFIEAANFNGYMVGSKNIEDLERSKVFSGLEEFNKVDLQSLKKTLIPDDQTDDDLNDEAHDNGDDVDLYPDYNPNYNVTPLPGYEALTDISASTGKPIKPRKGKDDLPTHSDGDQSNDDLEPPKDNDNTSPDDTNPTFGDQAEDGATNTDDSDSNLSNLDDSSSTLTDPSQNNDFGMGNDQQNNQDSDDDDKPTSSETPLSKKVYKSLFGNYKLKLATDTDLKGFYYRNAVSKLNDSLQKDVGTAIPISTKNTLDNWCKMWMYCFDVRCTINLLKDLKLTQYLKITQ